MSRYSYIRSARVRKLAKENNERYTKKVLSAWRLKLPPNPKCEICGQNLIYFSGNTNRSVHFDHKQENLFLDIRPSHWLRRNYPTIKNIRLFQVCNFGILCNRCNRILPVKNRKEWIQMKIQWAINALKYVEKKEVISMATYSLIRASGIRKLAKKHQKQCCADFLSALDRMIYNKIVSACKTFNGHRKRLTADLLGR